MLLPGFFNNYAANEQYTPIGYGTILPILSKCLFQQQLLPLLL